MPPSRHLAAGARYEVTLPRDDGQGQFEATGVSASSRDGAQGHGWGPQPEPYAAGTAHPPAKTIVTDQGAYASRDDRRGLTWASRVGTEWFRRVPGLVDMTMAPSYCRQLRPAMDDLVQLGSTSW